MFELINFHEAFEYLIATEYGGKYYALTCSDGTTAFALAVDEDALSAVPGARETYDSLMSDGIENNVSLSGGE